MSILYYHGAIDLEIPKVLRHPQFPVFQSSSLSAGHSRTACWDRAHIIETGTESYRSHRTIARKGGKRLLRPGLPHRRPGPCWPWPPPPFGLLPPRPTRKDKSRPSRWGQFRPASLALELAGTVSRCVMVRRAGLVLHCKSPVDNPSGIMPEKSITRAARGGLRPRRLNHNVTENSQEGRQIWRWTARSLTFCQT